MTQWKVQSTWSVSTPHSQEILNRYEKVVPLIVEILGINSPGYVEVYNENQTLPKCAYYYDWLDPKIEISLYEIKTLSRLNHFRKIQERVKDLHIFILAHEFAHVRQFQDGRKWTKSIHNWSILGPTRFRYNDKFYPSYFQLPFEVDANNQAFRVCKILSKVCPEPINTLRTLESEGNNAQVSELASSF